MIIITHFTSQIIPLAIGFGVGYGLFVVAGKSEGNLKAVGEALGWVIIASTIVALIFSFFYSLMPGNNSMNQGNPIYKIIQQQERPENDNDDNENGEAVEDNSQATNNTEHGINEELQANPKDEQGKPIKRDIHDHE